MTLRGQGAVSQLLNRTPEFRPNIFRAGLRGHALRIFGGLTNEHRAETLTDILFGGISRDRDTHVGLLGMAFRELKPAHVTDETYDVTGELRWLLTQPIATDEEAILKKLVRQLMQFAMVLGGFGKSWRRADHRLFLPDYEDHLIGCHWTWAGKRSPVYDNPVRRLADVARLIDRLQDTAKEWMTYRSISEAAPANWREAWHPSQVQVWGRIADTAEESEAIEWLHGKEYWSEYDQRGRPMPLQIKKTSITGGEINRSLNIGRLWHRMYPVVNKKPDPANPQREVPVSTPRYIELLTLFPDDTSAFDRFIQYLETEQEEFELLWGEKL
jgi:CRISPR-associated protein Cmr6